MELCSIKKVKVYVLGSTNQVNKKAIYKLKEKFPKLMIDGHHGYFDRNKNSDKIIQKINQFDPDILAVGLGMPIQEEWIIKNYKKINSHIFLNGGAFLDWISGKSIQCPQFISDIGMEWLWRLFLAPRRLIHRYVIGNFSFFINFLKK